MLSAPIRCVTVRLKLRTELIEALSISLALVREYHVKYGSKPLARRTTGDETSAVLITQLSDVHVGGSRYREELLRSAIEEVNGADLTSP